MQEPEEMPTIPEFFAGRTVFITGATGFMGKVLIDKLFYSCPDIKRIYVLLRPKKGHGVEERLEELRNNAAFTRLRAERPGVIEGPRFMAMAGDVTEEGLGLSAQDRATLTREVSIFYHVAATVRFDDPIRRAVLINTWGTLQAVKLAEEMKQLVVFMYVSTAYCNTDRFEIDEAVYPSNINWRSMLKMLEKFDDHTLEVVAPKLLRQLPNTYAFSKGLAEDVIYDHRHTIPAVIYRPSVVLSSIIEPMPGWLDNMNGPAGIMIGCGKGVIHSMYCNDEKVMDFTPVDYAIRGMVIATWTTGYDKVNGKDTLEPYPPEKNDGRCPNSPKVFNCTTSTMRPITIGLVVKIAITVCMQVPLNDNIWYPFGQTTTSLIRHHFIAFFMQILPAFFIDAILKARGLPPRLLKVQRRIVLATRAIAIYLNNEWVFPNNNFKSLQDSLLPTDVTAFDIKNYTEIDEYKYFKDCALGARKYLLNESEASFPAAKRHIQMMYWIDKLMRIIVVGFFVYCLCLYFEFGSTHTQLRPVQAN